MVTWNIRGKKQLPPFSRAIQAFALEEWRKTLESSIEVVPKQRLQLGTSKMQSHSILYIWYAWYSASLWSHILQTKYQPNRLISLGTYSENEHLKKLVWVLRRRLSFNIWDLHWKFRHQKAELCRCKSEKQLIVTQYILYKLHIL